MKSRLAVAAALLALAASLSAGVMEVHLKLPSKAKLPITSEQRIALAPFVVVSQAKDEKNDRAAKVDVQGEFARFLRKQISKGTKADIVTLNTTRLPTADWKALAANRDFWKGLGSQTGADYVVSGVIDFDVQDKAGYRTEEYVSPIDGRTYYRQVLVESTGFVFDIVFVVFNGETGEQVLEENFRDFKEFDQRNYDEILGLFENLRSLETQILGVFVSQETSATRYLFTK